MGTASVFILKCETATYAIQVFSKAVSPPVLYALSTPLHSGFLYLRLLCQTLEFEFILFLLSSLICNYGVTLAVLCVYPVTTKDTCIFVLSLF